MTQIHAAQRGEITPEMLFAADREQLDNCTGGRSLASLGAIR
jgi:thiamine biosynthesis protein ThiC